MSGHYTITRILDPINEHRNAMNAAKDKRVGRDTMASFYADCIRAGMNCEQVTSLNRAIMDRWPRGLVYIKTKAWKELTPKADAAKAVQP